MSIVRKKYKICFQNRLNLWNHKKLLNFKNKKWRWVSFSKKKEIFDSIFFVQHRKSLRFLFKGILRLKALLRLSRSLIRTKQFINIFNRLKNKSPHFNLFLNKLNSRVDFALYNSGIVRNVFTIRQYILHGFVTINLEKVRTPNVFLKPGDLLEFSPAIKYSIFKNIYGQVPLPKPLSYIFEINYNTLSLVVLPHGGIAVPYNSADNLELMNFVSN